MLLKEIISLETLLCQAETVKLKGSGPGFDGMTADAACIWMRVNGERLLHDLYNGVYHPMPAVGFAAAGQNGKYRQLSVIGAVDRIIQQCLLDAIGERMEKVFSPYSYAFRHGRGTAEALKQYCLYGEQYGFASKLDPKACFDSMSHDVLLKAIQRYIVPDAALMNILNACISQQLFMEGRITDRTQGVLPRLTHEA